MPFSAAPPALRPSLGAVFRVGIAEQQAEQAQPHPGASQLQVARAHTSKERSQWQPGSTQHTWQGSECPAGPRDPSLCLFPTHQGQFWLGQSLGPMQKPGSCVPVTSCFLLLDLKGSLGLPRGFSRNGTAPAWTCNPQHSHTQRNSRSVIGFTFDGGNEPVTHTGSSSFIPSLPTLHLPAANKRRFVSEPFLSCFQQFVSVTQQLLLPRAPEPAQILIILTVPDPPNRDLPALHPLGNLHTHPTSPLLMQHHPEGLVMLLGGRFTCPDSPPQTFPPWRGPAAPPLPSCPDQSPSPSPH